MTVQVFNNSKERTVRFISTRSAVTAVLLLFSGPALAELPAPPMDAAPRQADAFLFHAGAGDVFEITSGMMAMQKSKNSDVRAFASMLIADHTGLTNTSLATATGAGIMPPPPELSPMQKTMIAQLSAAGANFDRVYLGQQMTAHQQALALMQGYASSGDVPALRQTASQAVPTVQGHIAHLQRIMNSHER